MLSDNRTFFRSFPTENIHPTALIGLPPENRHHKVGRLHHGVQVDKTARIGAYCTVDGGYEDVTRIGARVWLMKSTHVGHDAQIGDDTEIAPHCSVGGHVVIGRNVKVGQGAIFKPRVRVGDGAVIGCGAIVVDDVPPHEVWVGNPARFLKKGYELLPDLPPGTIVVLSFDEVATFTHADIVAKGWEQIRAREEKLQTDEEMWHEQFERGRTR